MLGVTAERKKICLDHASMVTSKIRIQMANEVVLIDRPDLFSDDVSIELENEGTFDAGCDVDSRPMIDVEDCCGRTCFAVDVVALGRRGGTPLESV